MTTPHTSVAAAEKPARWRSVVLRQLTVTSWRELLRDPLAVGLSMVFPLSFVALFAFLPAVQAVPGTARVSGLIFGLPAVLLLAMMSLALTGTALPLTVLRQRGVLRSLACTPVSRGEFLLAQIPARLAVALTELALISAAATWIGALRVSDPLLLLWTVSLSFAVMLSLGFLLGGLSSSSELAGAVAGMLTPVVLLLSGVLIPISILPHGFQMIAQSLPFTYLGDLMRHSLAGLPLQFPLLRSSLICLGTAALFTTAALRTFRWDDGER